jgi:hypothetical protein
MFRINSDGTFNGTKVFCITPDGEIDISRFCMGVQVVIKPKQESQANIYLGAPLIDIIVEGKVVVWDEIRKGYMAAERARVAEELIYFASGLIPEVQEIFKRAIKDIIEEKTRSIITEEGRTKDVAIIRMLDELIPRRAKSGDFPLSAGEREYEGAQK